MAKLGFEKALIAVLDEQGVAIPEKTYTMDSTFGGTIEATISNIGAEATKVAASNVDYFISQKGHGELELELNLFELTDEQRSAILGQEYDDTEGETTIGADTAQPYVAVILQTADPKTNEDLYFGLTRGKLSQSDEEFATIESGGGTEPTTETFTGQFASRPSDKKAIIKKRVASGTDVSSYIAKVFNTTVTP